MKKKIICAVLSTAITAAMLSGCTSANTASENGQVYYLNFKPEQDSDWKALAKVYTEQTGIPVTIVTAASGTYSETLTAEMAKKEAPTLFQVKGPTGLASWEDYCYDLSDSDIYKNLISESFALKKGDEVAGIAYVIESYGIITNTELLAQAGYTVDDIKSFAELKKVAEDITARSAELGFAAFTSAGMDGSSDWRFKTHLANLPIYFEYNDDGISDTKAIKGTYLDNYKQIYDLYINNSTCLPKELASKTGDDAENEFAEGKAVFYQNGSWEYGSLTEKGMSEDKLQMIPIYIGAGDEANQGLCTGTENYWCVNSESSEKDIQATLEFINWCTSSDEGTQAMADMGFTIPFRDAKENSNVFVQQDAKYIADGKIPVSWNFTTMPSEEWKNGVGSALTAYAAGGSWDGVVTAFVDGWEREKALAE